MLSSVQNFITKMKNIIEQRTDYSVFSIRSDLSFLTSPFLTSNMNFRFFLLTKAQQEILCLQFYSIGVGSNGIDPNEFTAAAGISWQEDDNIDRSVERRSAIGSLIAERQC